MKHFRITWSLLETSGKKKFSFIVFLFIILSFLEVIGIAAVIPFVTLIFNPSSLNSIYFLNNFVGFFENNKDILLPIFCLIFFLIFLFKNIFYISTYKFVNKLDLFGIGYSWGGFESLAVYTDPIELGTRRYFKLEKNEHLVRLHIGLEDPKDLINDLKNSLKFIK